MLYMYIIPMFMSLIFVIVSGCGHCKRLAPVYEKVAETFKNDPNVRLSLALLYSNLSLQNCC